MVKCKPAHFCPFGGSKLLITKRHFDNFIQSPQISATIKKNANFLHRQGVYGAISIRKAVGLILLKTVD